MRVPALSCFAPLVLMACNDLTVGPGVDGSGGGSIATPTDPGQDAGASCLQLVPIQPSASPQVNGALCFGIALSASQALACTTSSVANLTECVDELLGLAYVVRWAGSSATVYEVSDGAQIGTLRQLAASSFDLTTLEGVAATCSFEAGPPVHARFCLRER